MVQMTQVRDVCKDLEAQAQKSEQHFYDLYSWNALEVLIPIISCLESTMII